MTKILLVDDDTELLFALSRLLKKSNYDVRSLSQAEDIHHTIESFRPSLIILDILLDNHDGRDICMQLKQNAKLSDVKIILYSAFQDMEDEYKAYGADDFIAKPFHGKDLLDRIQSHLQASAA